MTLAQRLSDFATAVAARIKAIRASDGSLFLGDFTVATLPVRALSERATAYASNADWSGGTGCEVIWNGTVWRDPDGNTASNVRRGSTSRQQHLADSYLGLQGTDNAFTDGGMTGLYDRNELANAAFRGAVSVAVTGAGTFVNNTASLNTMFDSRSGTFFAVNGCDVTTTQVDVVVDMLTAQPNYSNAKWQPFVQFRGGVKTGFSYSFFANVVVAVSTDGVTWVTPVGWSTSDFGGESFPNSYWFGQNAFPNPIVNWRYVRYRFTDFRQNAAYANKDKVWLCQLGMRHMQAEYSREYASVMGDEFYGTILLRPGSSVRHGVNVLSVGDDGKLYYQGSDTDTRYALSSTLTETIQDVVGTQLVAGANISLNYNDATGALTITGVGASAAAGGADRQLQFNNGGALDGSGKVDIATDGNLQLDTEATAPSTPPAGTLKVFARRVGGRSMLAQRGPSGLDTSLQPHLGTNRMARWIPAGNSTTIVADGAVGLAATGTATAANVTASNRHTLIKRLEYLVTTAATTAVAGFRGSAAQYLRGANPGDGGFHFVCRWGPATGVATTTSRAFVGMANSVAAPTDVEPSSQLNVIGMGWDAADTNIQIMHNDGAGVATKIDLGANFPVPTVDRSKAYDLSMFCAPAGTEIFYEVTDLGTGAVFTGSVTTDLPAATLLLAPRGQMSVGGTSSVIGIALMGLYLETHY